MSTPTLTKSQLSSLKAVIDAFLPSLPAPSSSTPSSEKEKIFWSYKLSEDETFIQNVTEAIETKLGGNERFAIKTMLSLLSSAIGTILLFFQFTKIPFSHWNNVEKERGMQNLQCSSWFMQRQVFHGFKRLICFHAFAYTDETDTNPFWGAMDYMGPYHRTVSSEEDERRIKTGNVVDDYSKYMVDVKGDLELEFDCVIVGSGAGGGVAAATLAQAGYSVLVIEKGSYVSPKNISQVEMEAYDTMYEKNALLATQDSNVMLVAASTLGGGPEVNWSCCIETPSYVRSEWSDKLGLKQFTAPEYDNALTSILKTMKATDENIVHNKNNSLFIKGCKELGYKVRSTKQNLKDTGGDAAGYIGFGDRYGNKNAVLNTFLADAVQNGAKILTQCQVEKVLRKNWFAVGILGHCGKHKVTVKAKRCVVVSAGSFHTPCLLLRSGFKNKNIGRHLHLHPATLAYGRFAEEVNTHFGAPMTTVSDQFSMGYKEDGHGAKLECPSLHTGIPALGLNWTSASRFKSLILKNKYMGSVLVLQRDVSEGRVSLSSDGFNPAVDYEPCHQDKVNIIQALKGAVQVLIAAGAEYVSTIHCDDQGLDLSSSPPSKKESLVSEYLSRIDAMAEKMQKLKIPLFSAHQMSTSRMGTDHTSSVVDLNGELWECNDLFVMDASVFPSASGANPMITTMAISHMLSQRLVKRLQCKGVRDKTGHVEVQPSILWHLVPFGLAAVAWLFFRYLESK